MFNPILDLLFQLQNHWLCPLSCWFCAKGGGFSCQTLMAHGFSAVQWVPFTLPKGHYSSPLPSLHLCMPCTCADSCHANINPPFFHLSKDFYVFCSSFISWSMLFIAFFTVHTTKQEELNHNNKIKLERELLLSSTHRNWTSKQQGVQNEKTHLKMPWC